MNTKKDSPEKFIIGSIGVPSSVIEGMQPTLKNVDGEVASILTDSFTTPDKIQTADSLVHAMTGKGITAFVIEAGFCDVDEIKALERKLDEAERFPLLIMTAEEEQHLDPYVEYLGITHSNIYSAGIAAALHCAIQDSMKGDNPRLVEYLSTPSSGGQSWRRVLESTRNARVVPPESPSGRTGP